MTAIDRLARVRPSLTRLPAASAASGSKSGGGAPPRDLPATPLHIPGGHDAGQSDGVRGLAPSARHASVVVHKNEVYVEVQDAGAIDLVDRALILALLEAGTAAEKEGPHVTTAVAPATCYGKVRVSPRSEEHLRHYLEAARNAAVGVLTAAHCRFDDPR